VKPQEINDTRIDQTRGEEWLALHIYMCRWLKEIAYQFAVLNDILSSDVNINIHHSGGGEQHDLQQLAKEIIKAMKEMTDDAKQAILDTLATLGKDIIDAANTAAKTETDQIAAFISKLLTQNGPITRDDLAPVLDMIKGIAPKVSAGVATSIDAISTGAGADTGTGGTPTTGPGPTP
jgi:hypothetical protein